MDWLKQRWMAVAGGLLAVGALFTWQFHLQQQQQHSPATPTSPVNAIHAPREPQPALARTPSARLLPQSAAVAADSSVRNADAFQQFDAWTERYLAAPPVEQPSLTTEGAGLAQARRAVLVHVIKADPERALALAVPMRVRQQLPPGVVAQLEERVNDRGRFEVLGVVGEAGTSIRRRVRTAERTYDAFVFGRRLQQTTKADLPVHGIAVDQTLALQESPVRVLEPGEIPDPVLLASAASTCPISKQSVAAPVLVQVGKTLRRLCHGGHIASFAEEVLAEEAGLGPTLAAASAWTQGAKTVLYMRVKFLDDATEPITQAAAAANMLTVSNFFVENSYGTTSLIPTVTPLLLLPRTKAGYALTDDYDGLLNDARIVALAQGFNTANYHLDCVHLITIFDNWGGLAYVGDKGTWLQSANTSVAAHEFGHNYGLSHANYWSTTDNSVIGAGSNAEYGDNYDVMGSGYGTIYHFNTYNKNLLGWLPNASVQTITTSGVYRVYAHDLAATGSGWKHALKIRKDTRDYWVEVRQKITANTTLQNGVLLRWSPWAQSNGGSELLDTTPGSNGGKNDAALLVGRTFEDTAAKIKIIPLAVTGTNPRAIDVQVIFTTTNLVPTVRIALSPDQLKFALTITGSTGAVLTIEKSSDLNTWSTLATVTNVTGTLQYLDARTPTQPRRFYRIRG